MKKTLLPLTVACALALAIAPSAKAQLIANDAFLTSGGEPANYNTGSDAGQNPTNTLGFAGGWSGGSSISSTPITYSGTTGYVTTPGAGSLDMTNAQTRDTRQLTNSVINAFTATSGTVYMSFEYQLPSVFVAGNDYQALELGDNGGNARFLQIGYSSFGDFGGSPSNFGVRVNDSAALRGNLGAADANAHLFVVALTLGVGATDSMTVWEDPTGISGSNPTGGTQVTISGFAVNNLDTSTHDFLGVGQFSQNGGATGMQISEVRIGNTVFDVVPEVPTSSLTLLGLGALVVVMARRKMVA
jgi:hypothetical protein